MAPANRRTPKPLKKSAKTNLWQQLYNVDVKRALEAENKDEKELQEEREDFEFETNNQRQFDHTDFFCLPACYGYNFFPPQMPVLKMDLC